MNNAGGKLCIEYTQGQLGFP